MPAARPGPIAGQTHSARLRASGRLACRATAVALLALACVGCGFVKRAQVIEEQGPEPWAEGAVPDAPAYDLARLIDIDMPAGSAVRMGVDPQTISVDRAAGVVRYVVVARGLSSVNATYEGVRCATGEFRIYARQVQGGEWRASSDDGWRSMRGQSSIMVRHPYQLARGGMCSGTVVRETPAEIARELRSGNHSLYN